VRHPPLRIVVVLCEDAAAYAVAGFEDFYFQAGAGQIYGGGVAGGSGAED